jgi:hypothetical protein
MSLCVAGAKVVCVAFALSLSPRRKMIFFREFHLVSPFLGRRCSGRIHNLIELQAVDGRNG